MQHWSKWPLHGREWGKSIKHLLPFFFFFCLTRCLFLLSFSLVSRSPPSERLSPCWKRHIICDNQNITLLGKITSDPRGKQSPSLAKRFCSCSLSPSLTLSLLLAVVVVWFIYFFFPSHACSHPAAARFVFSPIAPDRRRETARCVHASSSWPFSFSGRNVVCEEKQTHTLQHVYQNPLGFVGGLGSVCLSVLQPLNETTFEKCSHLSTESKHNRKVQLKIFMTNGVGNFTFHYVCPKKNKPSKHSVRP